MDSIETKSDITPTHKDFNALTTLNTFKYFELLDFFSLSELTIHSSIPAFRQVSDTSLALFSSIASISFLKLLNLCHFQFSEGLFQVINKYQKSKLTISSVHFHSCKFWKEFDRYSTHASDSLGIVPIFSNFTKLQFPKYQKNSHNQSITSRFIKFSYCTNLLDSNALGYGPSVDFSADFSISPKGSICLHSLSLPRGDSEFDNSYPVDSNDVQNDKDALFLLHGFYHQNLQRVEMRRFGTFSPLPHNFTGLIWPALKSLIFTDSKCPGFTAFNFNGNNFPKLQVFHCINIDKPLSFPDKSISTIHSLVTINFRGSLITKLPEDIGDLPNLCHLNIRSTPITCLPLSIKNLTKLVLLECRNADISTISSHSLTNMTSLLTLNLNSTRFKRLPLLPQSLSRLDVFSPYLNTIPPLKLPNLRDFYLSGNFSSLSLVSLQLVSFSVVRAQKLQNLDFLESCPNLRFLQLEDLTQVKRLPDFFSLDFFMDLETLILADIPLSKLNSKFFGENVTNSPLTHLKLVNLLITEFPVGTAQLFHLTSIFFKLPNLLIFPKINFSQLSLQKLVIVAENLYYLPMIDVSLIPIFQFDGPFLESWIEDG